MRAGFLSSTIRRRTNKQQGKPNSVSRVAFSGPFASENLRQIPLRINKSASLLSNKLCHLVSFEKIHVRRDRTRLQRRVLTKNILLGK